VRGRNGTIKNRGAAVFNLFFLNRDLTTAQGRNGKRLAFQTTNKEKKQKKHKQKQTKQNKTKQKKTSSVTRMTRTRACHDRAA
jgi:hypothetical protein